MFRLIVVCFGFRIIIIFVLMFKVEILEIVIEYKC